MPVDAGEVQARLTASGNMQAAVEQVTARIENLKQQIAALGNVTGPTMQMLQQNLVGAQQQLIQLQQASAQGAAGLGNVATASTGAMTEMQRLDNAATRIMERLVIFYALRAGYDFVVGLFEGAAAAEQLSAQLDISLTKVQELQYGAAQSDIPFQKVATAVDHLDKSLADLKPSTVDTLDALHLGLNNILNMNPDQRFDTIAEAIAKVPSALQRSKYEFALFGTDAIDPLLKNLKSLEEQAHSNNAVMGDETIHTLSQTVKMYKDMTVEVGNLVAKYIELGQKAVEVAAAPLFSDATIWQKMVFYAKMATLTPLNPQELEMLTNVPLPKGLGPQDIQLPSEFPAKGQTPTPNPNAPLTGQAYVDQLKAQSLAVKELTYAQIDQVQQLSMMNQFTADNAAKIGLTSTQYRELQRQIQAAREEETKLEAEDKHRATVAEQAMLQVTKLWDDYNAIVARGSTTFDEQVAAVDRWAEDLEAKAQKADTDTQEFYAALGATWTAKLKNLSMDTAALQKTATEESKAGLQQVADKAYNTYQEALKHQGEWSDETIEKFRQTWEDAQRKADNWGMTTAGNLDNVRAKVDQTKASVDALAGSFASMTTTPEQGGTRGAAGSWQDFFYQASKGSWFQGRASGGPVQAGVPYVVNENTPNSEIFIPSTSGYVSPASGMMRLGGGITVSPTIVMQSLIPTDPRAIEIMRQAVDSAMVGSLRNLVRMGRA